MLKKERVYREILFRFLEKEEGFLKQRQIAKKCGVSVGTINHALKPLEKINCIEKKPMGFRIINPKKIAIYWASIRNLKRDIIYETYTDLKIREIEEFMPSDVVYTAYSGYKFKFKTAPADYSEVYVYSKNLEEIKKRFLKKGPRKNLFVLKPDEHLLKISDGIVPLGQMYVDLWNLGTWYADEFLKDFEKRIKWSSGTI